MDEGCMIRGTSAPGRLTPSRLTGLSGAGKLGVLLA